MSRRGRGDGYIRQRKNGAWEAMLRYVDPITGLRERLSVFAPTRDDVVTKLDEARARLRRDERPRDRRVILSQFLELWLDDVVKPTLREWTHDSYSKIVKNHLIPSRLGDMALRDLREVQIQHVLVAKGKATPRIQQLCLIVLRRALEQAVKWGMIATNPADGIVAPRVVRRELRVLSPAEARRFLKATEHDRLHALYYLAIDTGMRQGELFALQWNDVDLRARTIRVMRSINTATGTIGPPKTKASRRRVELSTAAVAVLSEHKRRQEAEEYFGALVFPSPGGAPLSPSNVRIRSFLPAQLVAKINPPIRFHDLRHTAATLMLGAGVHPKIVSERLGHATIAITMDTYQHVSPTMQREAAAAMGTILSPKPKKRTAKGGQNGGTAARGRRSREIKKARKR